MSSSSDCVIGVRSGRESWVWVLVEVAGCVRAVGLRCFSLVRSHIGRAWCICVVLAVVRVVLGCGSLYSSFGGGAVVDSLSLVVEVDCVSCFVGVDVRLCALCERKFFSSLVNIVVGR